ncbi:hypothetical protein HZY97_20110 [Sphingomonas sp. R-74633]|uniref:hypothetical protein n=1 Tax=Sphingomonas sp. R-74633 TaxID=2751188 RepID=UPI0015D27FE7|nr:hypothetical protein [Sphingomonas sp. R-74633]NYT43090.1 hypothetical protein [Sphingomonas sp. R-74633]
MASVPTPDEMRDLLATLLEGAAGGSHREWLRAIGPVEKLPTYLNIHCNWAVHPKGKPAERKAIEQAVAVVRAAHPYVAP